MVAASQSTHLESLCLTIQYVFALLFVCVTVLHVYRPEQMFLENDVHDPKQDTEIPM
jgi:hypothetical protein